MTVERVRFPGRESRLVRVGPDADIDSVVAALDLSARRPVIVLNGGTDQLPPATAAALAAALAGVVAVAVELQATMVTGATDAGVFSLLGAALGRLGEDYVCLGVAPSLLTKWPGKPAKDSAIELVPLEPHHTHFIAVETASWGGETPVMMDVIAAVSSGMPTVAVLAGGGDGAALEVRAHLESRRPIIVLSGSGRLADQLAGVARGTGTTAGGFADLAASRQFLEVWEASEGPTALEAAVRRCLREE